MKRWLSTAEFGDALAARDPRVAKLSRWHRAQHARRLVRRAEEYEGVRCLRKVGRKLLISVRYLEALLPADAATVDRLDVEFAALNQEHRQLRGQVNAHGSAIRDLRHRTKVLERKEAITTKFLRDLAEAERAD